MFYLNQYKSILAFALLVTLTQTADNTSATTVASTTTVETTTYTTSESNCFYGFDTANTSQILQICVQSSDQISYHTGTTSDVVSDDDLNQIWILTTAAMVFLMNCGFSFLEVGMVQKKNTQTVLFKNLLNACLTAIGYYLFGFCLSYGKFDSSNKFLGVGDTVILSHNWDRWFYEWACSSIAVTIASCALAERATIFAYFINTLWMMWWVYPIIVHWLWSETGWLSPFDLYGHKDHRLTGGSIDFAGSAVVHIVGGWVGLAGCLLIKPRVNRFGTSNNNKKEEKQLNLYINGRDAAQQIIGCLIIWFGFYGFTCGRTLSTNNSMDLASKVAVNTTLSASMACVTVVILDRIFSGAWRVPTLCGGVLVGLVSISAPCSTIAPWMAIIIGCVGGILYLIAVKIEQLGKIDDPLTIWPTFGIGGFWGMIAVGFFSYRRQALLFSGYDGEVDDLGYGMIWGRQLLGAVIVALWAFCLGLLAFGILSLLNSLRVDSATEESGTDATLSHDQVSQYSVMGALRK